MTKENIFLDKKFIIGLISLTCSILFFGGFLSSFIGGIFDFSKVVGSFPTFYSNAGGEGARKGFMFAFSLIPAVMLAIAMVTVFEHYGALYTAGKILTPVLKPIMGIPGVSTVSLIASLQSTDAGSSSTRMIVDNNKMTHKEMLIFSAFQFSAGATITNFLASLSPLVLLQGPAGENVPVSIALALGVILIFKIIGANLMRLYLQFVVKEEVK